MAVRNMETATQSFAEASSRQQAVRAYNLWVKRQPFFQRGAFRDLGGQWQAMSNEDLSKAVVLQRKGLSVCKQAWRLTVRSKGVWSSASAETFSRRFAAVQAYKSIKVWQRCLKEAACKS